MQKIDTLDALDDARTTIFITILTTNLDNNLDKNLDNNVDNNLDINLDNNFGNNLDKKYRLPTSTGNPTNRLSLSPVPVPPISTLIGRQAGKYTNINTHIHGH